jgi:hypothetical protein
MATLKEYSYNNAFGRLGFLAAAAEGRRFEAVCRS